MHRAAPRKLRRGTDRVIGGRPVRTHLANCWRSHLVDPRWPSDGQAEADLEDFCDNPGLSRLAPGEYNSIGKFILFNKFPEVDLLATSPFYEDIYCPSILFDQ